MRLRCGSGPTTAAGPSPIPGTAVGRAMRFAYRADHGQRARTEPPIAGLADSPKSPNVAERDPRSGRVHDALRGVRHTGPTGGDQSRGREVRSQQWRLDATLTALGSWPIGLRVTRTSGDSASQWVQVCVVAPPESLVATGTSGGRSQPLRRAARRAGAQREQPNRPAAPPTSARPRRDRAVAHGARCVARRNAPSPSTSWARCTTAWPRMTTASRAGLPR